LEVVNENPPRGPFRCIVFDFDGTLSLLRGNWQGLMVPMMVEALAATGTAETTADLTALVEEFVTRLTGQPTMQQMLALCDEVEKRGRPRPSAEDYLARYLDRLLARTRQRIEDTQSGRTPVDSMLIPGSRPLLEKLLAAGKILAIASGTELGDVQKEAAALKIDHYFGPRIFGPVNNDPRFSKEAVLRRLLDEHELSPEQVVAVGDGPAEILAIKAVGGLAIGLASDEVHQDGRVNRLKREHLLRSGADVILSDYSDIGAILTILNVAV
jgi:phosphoglycolate phosphatase-like HAD superfamily hydrolase